MSLLSLFIFFSIGLFFTSICTYQFSECIKGSPYGRSFWGFIIWGFSSRAFGFLMLGAVGLLSVVMMELVMFHDNNISTAVLVIISISSLILTIVSSYVFIKGLKNPPYKNILFQWIIFILLGLYTMVLSVLKMFDVTLWLK